MARNIPDSKTREMLTRIIIISIRGSFERRAAAGPALSGMADSRRPRRLPPEGFVLTWDLPAPHAISITVSAAEIDAYDHVNNSVYMTWFERAAWITRPPSVCRSSNAWSWTAAWWCCAASSPICDLPSAGMPFEWPLGSCPISAK